jgi:DNA-binding transcriptional LysR family regulator
MDRLDELAVFVAILDAGSLARTARRLRRSPPAITRALGSLEERLGVRLVERTTRRLAPTEEGRRLADQARRLLADYEEVLRQSSGSGALRGTLRVTAPLVFGRRHVAPVLTSFLDAHPALRADLVLNDRNVDLIEEGLDVGVRIGRLADSALVTRRVGAVRRVLVASPDYVARCGAPQAPHDLAGHDVIYVASRPIPPEWRFGGDGAPDETIRLTPRFSVNEIDAMLMAVEAGRGVGRALSYQVADLVAAGRLVRLLKAFEPPPLPVQLVVPSARHMAPRVRAFVEHAAATLSRLEVVRSEGR